MQTITTSAARLPVQDQLLSSAAATVYVITGTSRGIGYGLVEWLASRPNAIIYAGARHASTATKLHQLIARHGSHVRLLQLDAESDEDHEVAARQVEAEVGRVDVLLANAGTADEAVVKACSLIPLDGYRRLLEVNVVGPLRLYQHFHSLLSRSSQPKFVVVSSATASNAAMESIATLPTASYSSSKAAINHIVRKIHFEQSNLCAFPIHPGTVQTELGELSARVRGLAKAPVTLPDCVRSLVTVMDEATRASHGGRFWNAVDGKEIPW